MRFFIIFIVLIQFLYGKNKTFQVDQNIAENFAIEDKITGVIPQDLTIYPQDIKHYLHNLPKLSKKQKDTLLKKFFKHYFLPWDRDRMQLSSKRARWGEMYKKMKMYGENYQRIPKSWFDKVIKNSNMKRYDTIKLKAITVRNADLKVFPTTKPMFKSYIKAGEGFPFDYNQNTSIKINTPLHISHYSKDKAWAYVQSTHAAGWVQVTDIAIVSKSVQKIYRNNTLSVAIEDNLPIYKNGVFRDYVYIGTIFPRKNNKLITVIRDNTGSGYISTIDKNKSIVPFPIPFTKKNIALLLNQMIGQAYGWGGLFNNRDCSLLTKDFYTTFGFSLERNSYGQTKNGSYISVKKLTNKQKLEKLKKHGIPFLSLVYIKGHIGIYIGTHKGVPLMIHAVWGIKTDHNDEDGRIIIGKTIISSLELGKEFDIYDEKKNILSKMEGIVLLK